VLVLLIVFGGPLLVGAAADLIPRSWEESLGRAAINALSPPSERCDDPGLRAALDTITTRLARDTAGYTFHVIVVDSPVINAVAAPGGHIAIYRGLVEATGTPEQLAGVLAHEMQHVTQRHSTRGLVRAVGIAGLAAMIFGDASAIGGIAGQLGQLSFQRADEERADLEGIRALRAASIDPRAMIAAYRKLEQDSPDTTGALRYLSTHPQMAGRIEKLERLAARQGGPPPQPLGIAGWSNLKLACATR
jgi:predicted Zn-dependent protease